MSNTLIHALDFDGVICDSAVETALTGWKAAARIWPDMPTDTPPALIESFRQARPIIETGYEAILAMRLLHLGDSVAAIFSAYADKTQALLTDAGVTVDDLKQLFGATRDAWIATDLPDWVAMNPLFPCIADRLRSLMQQHLCYIVTTKQERFVKQILNAHGLELADERIFGLDRNLSKIQVLNNLLAQHPGLGVCFLEDRLPTLQNVQQQPELSAVKLRFAMWGYNTNADKRHAAEQGFALVELQSFPG